MKIAVFCSGRGTNLAAIIKAVKKGAIKAKIALVVSDNDAAYALKRAKRAKIAVLVLKPRDFKDRFAYDKEIVRHLRREKIDLVVLAGFMCIITPYFVKAYRDRILNLHPALLPSFAGTDGIGDALKYGVKVTGATVHFVDDKVDHGPIIIQKALDVRGSDTHDTLARRIHKIEHRIYPEAIRLFVEGRLKIVGRTVKIIKG